VPEIARTVIRRMADQVAMLDEQIRRLDAEILAWHRSSAASQLLATIPGVALLRRLHWPRPCPIPPTSDRVGPSPRGSGSRPEQTLQAARSGSAGSPRWAVVTSGPAGRGRDRRHSIGAHAGRELAYEVDPRAAGEEAGARRQRGLGQQDGPRRLGRARARRGIQAEPHCGRVAGEAGRSSSGEVQTK
jgi:hypothetical protein